MEVGTEAEEVRKLSLEFESGGLTKSREVFSMFSSINPQYQGTVTVVC